MPKRTTQYYVAMFKDVRKRMYWSCSKQEWVGLLDATMFYLFSSARRTMNDVISKMHKCDPGIQHIFVDVLGTHKREEEE